MYNKEKEKNVKLLIITCCFDLVLPDLQLVVVTEEGQRRRGGPAWRAVVAIVAVNI